MGNVKTEELRFKVVEGSQTAHCCFEATVVDTNKPIVHGSYKPEGRYEPVCECFSKADADTVCAALNAVEEEVVEDAARYRKLCEPEEWPEAVDAAFDCGNKFNIDIAVDAFMSTLKDKTE